MTRPNTATRVDQEASHTQFQSFGNTFTTRENVASFADPSDNKDAAKEKYQEVQ